MSKLKHRGAAADDRCDLVLSDDQGFETKYDDGHSSEGSQQCRIPADRHVACGGAAFLQRRRGLQLYSRKCTFGRHGRASGATVGQGLPFAKQNRMLCMPTVHTLHFKFKGPHLGDLPQDFPARLDSFLRHVLRTPPLHIAMGQGCIVLVVTLLELGRGAGFAGLAARRSHHHYTCIPTALVGFVSSVLPEGAVPVGVHITHRQRSSEPDAQGGAAGYAVEAESLADTWQVYMSASGTAESAQPVIPNAATRTARLTQLSPETGVAAHAAAGPPKPPTAMLPQGVLMSTVHSHWHGAEPRAGSAERVRGWSSNDFTAVSAVADDRWPSMLPACSDDEAGNARLSAGSIVALSSGGSARLGGSRLRRVTQAARNAPNPSSLLGTGVGHPVDVAHPPVQLVMARLQQQHGPPGPVQLLGPAVLIWPSTVSPRGLHPAPGVLRDDPNGGCLAGADAVVLGGAATAHALTGDSKPLLLRLVCPDVIAHRPSRPRNRQPPSLAGHSSSDGTDEDELEAGGLVSQLVAWTRSGTIPLTQLDDSADGTSRITLQLSPPQAPLQVPSSMPQQQPALDVEPKFYPLLPPRQPLPPLLQQQSCGNATKPSGTLCPAPEACLSAQQQSSVAAGPAAAAGGCGPSGTAAGDSGALPPSPQPVAAPMVTLVHLAWRRGCTLGPSCPLLLLPPSSGMHDLVVELAALRPDANTAAAKPALALSYQHFLSDLGVWLGALRAAGGSESVSGTSGAGGITNPLRRPFSNASGAPDGPSQWSVFTSVGARAGGCSAHFDTNNSFRSGMQGLYATGPGTAPSAGLTTGAATAGSELLARQAEAVLMVGCDLLVYAAACGAVVTARLIMELMLTHGSRMQLQHLEADAVSVTHAGGSAVPAADGALTTAPKDDGDADGAADAAAYPGNPDRRALALQTVLEYCRLASEAGHTLLHLAVMSRSLPMLRLVAVEWPQELGVPLAELNRMDRSGRTPAAYVAGAASRTGSFEVEATSLLRGVGGDPGMHEVWSGLESSTQSAPAHSSGLTTLLGRGSDQSSLGDARTQLAAPTAPMHLSGDGADGHSLRGTFRGEHAGAGAAAPADDRPNADGVAAAGGPAPQGGLALWQPHMRPQHPHGTATHGPPAAPSTEPAGGTAGEERAWSVQEPLEAPEPLSASEPLSAGAAAREAPVAPQHGEAALRTSPHVSPLRRPLWAVLLLLLSSLQAVFYALSALPHTGMLSPDASLLPPPAAQLLLPPLLLLASGVLGAAAVLLMTPRQRAASAWLPAAVTAVCRCAAAILSMATATRLGGGGDGNSGPSTLGWVAGARICAGNLEALPGSASMLELVQVLEASICGGMGGVSASRLTSLPRTMLLVLGPALLEEVPFAARVVLAAIEHSLRPLYLLYTRSTPAALAALPDAGVKLLCAMALTALAELWRRRMQAAAAVRTTLVPTGRLAPSAEVAAAAEAETEATEVAPSAAEPPTVPAAGGPGAEDEGAALQPRKDACSARSSLNGSAASSCKGSAAGAVGGSDPDGPPLPRRAAAARSRALRDLLFGFPSPSLERSYQAFKARQCATLDLVGLATHALFRVVLLCRALFPSRGSEQADLALFSIGLNLVANCPVALVAFVTPLLSRHRNKLLLLRSILDLLALGAIAWPLPGGGTLLPVPEAWRVPTRQGANWAIHCFWSPAVAQLSPYLQVWLALLEPVPMFLISRQYYDEGSFVAAAAFGAGCAVCGMAVSIATDAFTRWRFARHFGRTAESAAGGAAHRAHRAGCSDECSSGECCSDGGSGGDMLNICKVYGCSGQ